MQYICSEQIEIKLNCKFSKPACEGRLASFYNITFMAFCGIVDTQPFTS